MAVLEAIAALIKVLPQVFSLIERLGALVKEKSFNDWVGELNDTVRQLETSQSLQDRVAAARRLSDLVRRM